MLEADGREVWMMVPFHNTSNRCSSMSFQKCANNYTTCILLYVLVYLHLLFFSFFVFFEFLYLCLITFFSFFFFFLNSYASAWSFFWPSLYLHLVLCLPLYLPFIVFHSWFFSYTCLSSLFHFFRRLLLLSPLHFIK